MVGEFTAQLATRAGCWRLYVVLMDTTAPWPVYDVDRAGPPPTFTERSAVLKRLGFEPVPHAVWTWEETSEEPADPASPVRLIATARVRSRPGVVA
ncbi:hypothetical protein FM076_16060 [Streptomyces albus subsp. chlorinus]|uniref:DUF6303 family protein n=1 Tax=Streptomyces albus TaxID=1888 RepID=UPI00156F355A|nr:DUF6303 family protein [Streptomyces albus]NSC22603.1 hypothetical protein [Streptomyces albus subsp. chlorinus]